MRPLFTSIRWRLMTSYVLITLLTAILVGMLATAIIRRYTDRRERAYLTENAEAVAQQALPLVQRTSGEAYLRELATMAAFLTNARVRILDENRRPLADSGPSSEGDTLAWITIPETEDDAADAAIAASMISLSQDRLLPQGETPRTRFTVRGLPPGTDYALVHRTEDAWGNRISFSDTEDLDEDQALGPSMDAQASQEFLGEGSENESEHRVSVPIGPEGDPVGYVEMTREPSYGRQTLVTAWHAFLGAAGGAVLLASLVSLLVSQQLTAPLQGLSAAAERMSQGDLSARSPIQSEDEIGNLARQFNRMAEQLEDSFADLEDERDSLRRFIADASHGLRTPITALRNFNELLQGSAGEAPHIRAEFLAESQAQLERLEWITHNLLDLSRLEAGLTSLDLGEHNVEGIVESAVNAFKCSAQKKAITIGIKLPDSHLKMRCDRTRVELALSNLLDNALKFTPAGGAVEIGARRAGQSVQLWVEDSGPGIAPSEQKRIFERFYRGSDSSSAGSGLGLAIVQSIVQAHDGHVTVESERGSGSRFTIHLPVSGESEPGDRNRGHKSDAPA